MEPAVGAQRRYGQHGQGTACNFANCAAAASVLKAHYLKSSSPARRWYYPIHPQVLHHLAVVIVGMNERLGDE
jgi:hypothetical protein